jgi:hypothetical protein
VQHRADEENAAQQQTMKIPILRDDEWRLPGLLDLLFPKGKRGDGRKNREVNAKNTGTEDGGEAVKDGDGQDGNSEGNERNEDDKRRGAMGSKGAEKEKNGEAVKDKDRKRGSDKDSSSQDGQNQDINEKDDQKRGTIDKGNGSTQTKEHGNDGKTTSSKQRSVKEGPKGGGDSKGKDTRKRARGQGDGADSGEPGPSVRRSRRIKELTPDGRQKNKAGKQTQ